MAKSQLALPLSLSFPPDVHQPASQAEAETPQPLWLALVFPKLALEVHDKQRRDIPAVAVREHKGRSVVHTASQMAELRGIHIGMAVNAAFALCPGLKVYPLNEQSQIDRLQQLAVWAGQFTSMVNVQSPQALLLEVRGSMKLFGGLSVIQDQIQQQLRDQWQHSFYSAVAPTPGASLLLASSGHSEVVQNRQHLRSALGHLSVDALLIELKVKQRLRNTGVRLLRDLWRLPRDGLARRFGPELVNYLDRTLGLLPDPMDYFASPEKFEAHYEFPMEVYNTDLLFNVAQQLLQQLAAFLRQRDICINQCRFRLYQNKHAAANIIIGVRQATRDDQHLSGLLKEHLNRLSLQAPVKIITLTAEEFIPFSPQDYPLFLESLLEPPQACKESDINSLLEQLQARVGYDAIKSIHSVADHRPEYAYRINQSVSANSVNRHRQRPFWLLPEPQLLTQKNHRPWLQGPVTLIKGPERIQSGWWADHDIHRDYYIAMDYKGCRLWIYQELNEHCQWYLHGLFA